MRPYKKGFTFIELLVVISIISLLASIILASLNAVRIKARDSKRIQEIIQLRTAMELYYDTNGTYPPTLNENSGYDLSYLPAGSPNFIPSLVPSFITENLKDPFNTDNYHAYHYLGTEDTGHPEWCPGSERALVKFHLEKNLTTPRFQTCDNQGAPFSDSWGRCLCFY